MLEGKLAPSEDFYKADKFQTLHQRIQDINDRASRKRSTGAASAASRKRKSSSSKVQWQYLVHKLHLAPDHATVVTNPVAAVALNSDHTVGASHATEMLTNGDLNRDEHMDDEDKVTTTARGSAIQHSNPIYRAFENVEDVDDLYRLAETLINSAYSDNRS